MASSTPVTAGTEGATSLRDQYVGAIRLVPVPVAIIACAFGDQWLGLTATSWSSLSTSPPTLIACVNQTAPAHDLIREAGRFSINLLPCSDARLVPIFSGQGPLQGNDRFNAEDWRPGELGQPLLLSAVAAFECALEESHVGRSHTIFVGTVRFVQTQATSSPLVYRNGRLHESRELDAPDGNW